MSAWFAAANFTQGKRYWLLFNHIRNRFNGIRCEPILVREVFQLAKVAIQILIQLVLVVVVVAGVVVVVAVAVVVRVIGVV